MLLVSFSACIDNSIDSQEINNEEKPRTINTLLTKSLNTEQEDSITIISKLQSDIDYLMMGRVIKKDSIFILAIKKNDALFLGVSEEEYDKYLDYVDRLNESIEK